MRGRVHLPPRYIRHLTLDTGHQRDSYRDEVDDGVLELLRPMLDRAVRGEHVPVPGAVEPSGCTMSGGVGRSRALLLTVSGPTALGRHSVERTPIVQIAVAPDSLASAELWRTWIGSERDDRTPRPPWCAVRLMAGMAVYPQAAHWLGDYERCCAWAWIDRGARR